MRRLDIDGRFGADIVVDIRNWDPAVDWSDPAPDVIFAGPPCEHYSSARTRAKTPRDLELADSLVTKTIEIIQHFHAVNPALQFFVENPDSSMLWTRWVSHRLYEDVSNHPTSVFVKIMNGIKERKTVGRILRARSQGFRESCKDGHAVRLDYCQYGTKYRKRTRLMTNNPFSGSMCKKNCGNVRDGRHVEVAQRGPYKHSDKTGPGKFQHTLDELHAYPADLAKAIFKHVDGAIRCERQGVRPESTEPALIPLT